MSQLIPCLQYSVIHRDSGSGGVTENSLWQEMQLNMNCELQYWYDWFKLLMLQFHDS